MAASRRREETPETRRAAVAWVKPIPLLMWAVAVIIFSWSWYANDHHVGRGAILVALIALTMSAADLTKFAVEKMWWVADVYAGNAEIGVDDESMLMPDGTPLKIINVEDHRERRAKSHRATPSE